MSYEGMSITKLGHSCVLVSANSKTALFDPGAWSDVNVNLIEKLDYVVYTHEHPDHFDIETLRTLVDNFTNLEVISNQQIADQITDADMQVKMQRENDACQIFTAPHEELPMPGAEAPAENGYHFAGVFSHPGDSQRFDETCEILAMPFIGSWGKTGDSIGKVLELKPRYVLPIHDWHYTDEAKEWLQGVLKTALEPAGITVLPNENGKLINMEEM